MDAVEENTGEAADTVLADAGYLSEENLVELRRRGQRCLVATGRERKKAPRWPRSSETRRMHWIMRLPWACQLYAHRKTQGERPSSMPNSPFQKEWNDIATRWGLSVETPSVVEVAGGEIAVPVLLRDLGGARGMLLVTDFSVISARADALVDRMGILLRGIVNRSTDRPMQPNAASPRS